MGIAHVGKMQEPKVARTNRGLCGICLEQIVSGQAYYNRIGGTNSRNARPAHYNCFKPSGAPSYEELQKIRKNITIQNK